MRPKRSAPARRSPSSRSVRADLTNLDGLPSNDDLRGIVAARSEQGIRYLAVGDRRHGVVAAAGTPLLESGGTERELGPRRAQRKVVEGKGRLRVELRTNFRRWGEGGGGGGVADDRDRGRSGRGRAAARGRRSHVGDRHGRRARAARRRDRAGAARAAPPGRRARAASASAGSPASARCRPCSRTRSRTRSRRSRATRSCSSRCCPTARSRTRRPQRVVDEALRLEQLTKDLLAFVRTGELARAPADPAALARDAIRDLPGVTIDVARAPATWSARRGARARGRRRTSSTTRSRPGRR